MRATAVLAIATVLAFSQPTLGDTVRVASKTFTESYVLGEIVTQLLESRGLQVSRKLGLGGTLVTYEALRAGSIDVYPEYTGTLAQAVLGTPGMARAELDSALEKLGLHIGVSFGFNNSYAIAVREDLAQSLQLSRISDLRAHPHLTAIFSHEFLNRDDGWATLRQRYGLAQDSAGIEHALAYDALERGQADITEAYTTDGELTGRAIRLLEDDLGFFPDYAAVLLVRTDLPPTVHKALQDLAGVLDEQRMRELNHRVAIGGESPARVAGDFLRSRALVSAAAAPERGRTARIAANTLTHLKLTGIALLAACLVAIPAALMAFRVPGVGRALLYISGLLQTIPALALLALLIPVFGLGQLPAIIALFLYSLLPIVRNTLTGLFSVDPLLKEVATGMGLSDSQRLGLVELPLAVPMILAGVKTAAIVSIGTATLAAFVGAGGLGEPIISGLNLNNHRLILEGAIPAALLAIAVEFGFEFIERLAIPAHLRPRGQ